MNEEQKTIVLSQAEIEYIWLISALDALRIRAMEPGLSQDAHDRARYSLRRKLFEATYGGPKLTVS